jgi:hypothetical protein
MTKFLSVHALVPMLGLVVLLVLVGVLLLWRRQPSADAPGYWPVRPRHPLTPMQLDLYWKLVHALPGYLVLAQQALGQCVETKSSYAAAPLRDALQRLTVDFLVCRRDGVVIAVVEMGLVPHAGVPLTVDQATKAQILRASGLKVVHWRIPPDAATIREALQVPAADQAPTAPDAGRYDWPAEQARSLSSSEHLQVEELMDVSHLAESLMAKGDDSQAIAVLEEVLDSTGFTTDALALPYLYLFELYRKHGMRADYQQLHERYRGRFNVNMPDWGQSAEGAKRSLQDYPEAVALLASHGDDPAQLAALLVRLLASDRAQPRHGFDLPAYRELLVLHAKAQADSSVDD